MYKINKLNYINQFFYNTNVIILFILYFLALYLHTRFPKTCFIKKYSSLKAT